jgi:hypothetical protein
MTRLYKIGKHMWGVCEDCGSLVKLTGWARGHHLCIPDPPPTPRRRSPVVMVNGVPKWKRDLALLEAMRSRTNHPERAAGASVRSRHP